MTKRRSLPLTPEQRPTVDATRERLGGRARSNARLGEVVRLDDGTVGVVVFGDAERVHVALDERRIRAVGADLARPAEPTPDLVEIRRDVLAFAQLAEGEDVRYWAGQTFLAEGRLVEKCRYGALVLRPDGTIVGVGYRRLVAPPRSNAPPS